jgi:Fic family protein
MPGFDLTRWEREKEAMSPIPYASESATSRDAANSMRQQAETHRRRVFAAVLRARAEGLTCDEYEAVSGLSHQTASARFNELVKEGRIVPSCRTRTTRHGRQAFVYIAVALFCPTDQQLLIRD